MTDDDPILSLRGVSHAFGGLRVLQDVSFDVAAGSITALIGPNGAGKTTLFNAITGFTPPRTGTIQFEGVAVNGWPAYRIAQHGLVRTFQTTRTLRRMTVLENLMLAAPDQPGERPWAVFVRPGSVRAAEHAVRARAAALLERFKLQHLASEYAGVLSGGQRKLLELARALMLRPRLLLLDEPMAGVNPVLGQTLMEHVARLRDEDGVTILFVEHDMRVVMSFAETVVVMAEGRVLSIGSPSEVRADRRVVDAYLGSPV